ncbi:DUF547 domain-containing protein [uncultured Winogradskyella sp.]|uniref:DUF547 domain-containing protein n=1 Tax=uncultured Winogradskyella sp. TaxID=395353 RepID=UPI0030D95F44|tara:strand:+ start:1225 stop:2157 length:933 start_codon:yes stop_codon:yes gene_type:complete
MQYISTLILILFVSSCYGTKNVTETQPEPVKKIAVVTEVPDVVETEPSSDDGEIQQMVEVVDNEGNTIAEVENEDEAIEVLKNIETKKLNDSVYFIKVASHDKWQKLLQKNVSEKGNVNYLGFKKDKTELKEYINYLSENQPTEKWIKNDKLAYWINAYNALTVDLIIRNHPTKSIKNIKDPWDQRLWQFGDKWQNLNDIEHKILRKMNEPRIHFAIVCASVSCPKLQNEAFTAANLEEQLTNATKEFLADTSKNELSKDRIKLSKIFKWFKGDFEQNGSLIDFLNQYSDVEISDKAKKNFKDYNWDLND